MDKNRAIVALVVIVFLVVVSMLYVIFVSKKKHAVQTAQVQTFEEGSEFDIDNDISNVIEDEQKDDLDAEVIAEIASVKKDEIKKETQRNQVPPKKAVAISGKSPKTGPGSTVPVLALAMSAISAGIVYKKTAKK